LNLFLLYRRIADTLINIRTFVDCSEKLQSLELIDRSRVFGLFSFMTRVSSCFGKIEYFLCTKKIISPEISLNHIEIHIDT